MNLKTLVTIGLFALMTPLAAQAVSVCMIAVNNNSAKETCDGGEVKVGTFSNKFYQTVTTKLKEYLDQGYEISTHINRDNTLEYVLVKK